MGGWMDRGNHHLLCAVFAGGTSPPRLQAINGAYTQTNTAFETFHQDWKHYFFGYRYLVESTSAFPLCRGMILFPLGKNIFHEPLASRSSPLLFHTPDFLLCCASFSSLLHVWQNFFPYSSGFWSVALHWCEHGGLFLKHGWHAFNWWLRNL